MLSMLSLWGPLALLNLGVKGSNNDDYLVKTTLTTSLTTCPEDSTVHVPVKTTSSLAAVPTTHYVDVTISHYVDITISKTKIDTVSTCVTESSTTTLHYTVSITDTDKKTVTEIHTTTSIVPATITTYTTQTVLSVKVDPCPTTCSLSAGTVNLFFWPTGRPYTYPSTYVDTALAYTFTSPSVYMLIPTLKGTNSLGPAGPSTSRWILPLDLTDVSTIVGGTITRQLTLNDLGTDCPQTAEPSAIATLVDSRCDPILAAPKQVTSWANPCNACGRFGLFDPPYAIPTLTGPLVESTTVAPVKTTVAPAPTSAPPVGTILVVYYSDGKPVATATIPTTGVSGTFTSSIMVSPTAVGSSSSQAVNGSSATKSASSPVTASSSPAPTTKASSSPSSSSSGSATSSVVTTGAAPKVTSGLSWLFSIICTTVYFM